MKEELPRGGCLRDYLQVSCGEGGPPKRDFVLRIESKCTQVGTKTSQGDPREPTRQKEPKRYLRLMLFTSLLGAIFHQNPAKYLQQSRAKNDVEKQLKMS